MRSVLALLFLVFATLPSLAMAQEAVLEVTSTTEGALVLFDGELLGDTPLLEIVPAGKHTIVVTLDGFADYEEVVTLAPDSEVQVVASLLLTASALSVEVDVFDAQVFLDGKLVGSGREVNVENTSPGQHVLRVVAENYPPFERTVELRPGKRSPVNVKLRGDLGAIVLSGKPTGATVLLDGREAGKLPLTIEPVQPGSHSLIVRADGYSDYLQALVVDAGASARLEARLSKEGGSVEIKPNVGVARVSLNGVEVGKGELTLGPLKPGLYSVKISAPGYSDYVKPLQVTADETASLSVKLERYTGLPGDGGATASKPVGKRPGFWAALGGGAGAVVAGVIIAAAVANDNNTNTDPAVVTPPATDVGFTLP